MSGVDLEAIRLRADNDECEGVHGSGSCEVCDAAWVDRGDLLAEVDRLRAALTRIVDDSGDAHHHASRALEGNP